MIELTVETEGVTELHQKLLVAADGMEDFQIPLESVSQMLLKTFDMNFDTEGALLESPWKPRTSGGDWPLLVKTGAMRSSFASYVNPTQVTITNWAPYFKYHQSNLPRKSNLPRRVMMKLTESLRRSMVRAFQLYVQGALGKWLP